MGLNRCSLQNPPNYHCKHICADPNSYAHSHSYSYTGIALAHSPSRRGNQEQHSTDSRMGKLHRLRWSER